MDNAADYLREVQHWAPFQNFLLRKPCLLELLEFTFLAAVGRPSYQGEERSIAQRWEPAL